MRGRRDHVLNSNENEIRSAQVRVMKADGEGIPVQQMTNRTDRKNNLKNLKNQNQKITPYQQLFWKFSNASR